MLYRILLILIISIFPGLKSAIAEDSRYRVEILVLTHLRHDEEAREVQQLENFSDALDFLQPPDDTAETGAVGETAVPEAMQAEATLDRGMDDGPDEEFLAESEQDRWAVVTPVEVMGPEMQEAWRRLRLSAPFRPLQYLAWEQGSNEPFPVLRVHDLEIVLLEDPWAEQRLLLAETGEATVFTDKAVPAMDGADADSEALPEPIKYYRLDGTASLTRSRFLHLALAIEWREPVFDESEPVAAIALLTAPGDPPSEPLPSSFLVHRLEQSRPLRTGRMEYFDGPVLGVLAWVSNITDTFAEQVAD